MRRDRPKIHERAAVKIEAVAWRMQEDAIRHLVSRRATVNALDEGAPSTGCVDHQADAFGRPAADMNARAIVVVLQSRSPLGHDTRRPDSKVFPKPLLKRMGV